MCGIAGILGFDLSAPDARDLVGSMCDAIAHRGPDGGGVVDHPDATLGMKRLAIVDVEHGAQPMMNDDRSIAIVYNGEIYNAPALRKGLEAKGVRFVTRSDTEVVLRLYEQDPERVEQELVGMWAFAIHDRARRKVLLSRDRFGIKPLFVVDAGQSLAFASELQCFRKLHDHPRFRDRFALDPSSAHAMLAWGYIPEDGTIYRGVKRLPPASRVTIDLASDRREPRRYWTATPSPESARVTSLDDACALVEPLLRRAVSEHLESDVPVATFLSGGIDSSLVTACAVDASTRPIEAYAIGFHDPRFDESPHARDTAKILGVPLHVEYLDENAARTSLADALLAYDEPFGDSSSIATYLVSKCVAKHHKVALGGDGGDEVFGGYKKHRIVDVRRRLALVPALRDALGSALARIPVRTDRSRGWTELLRSVRRASRGLHGTDAAAYVALTQVGALAKTSPLLGTAAHAEHFESSARERFESSAGTQLQRTLLGDLASPLPNDMLTKVDRASMACHLEARVPFLDHRLVEAGLGLPQEFTLGHSGKEVLRALHARRFGARLANRKKQGFGVPVEKWLRGSLGNACDELFSRKRLERDQLLAADTLSDGGWRTWAQNDPQLLWHAFALAAWCEATRGGGPEKLRELLA